MKITGGRRERKHVDHTTSVSHTELYVRHTDLIYTKSNMDTNSMNICEENKKMSNLPTMLNLTENQQDHGKLRIRKQKEMLN